MPDPFLTVTDSAGQTVVIVRNKVTRLVSAGSTHTEVYLVDGSFVRIPHPIAEVTARFRTSPVADDAATHPDFGEGA